jgi:uncharacterized membrane protein
MIIDLLKSLERWCHLGLIGEDQAQRIHAHEKSLAAHDSEHSWITRGFVILGTVIIGIGAISQIAAHWIIMPDWMKLLVCFLSLIGLAGIVWIFQNKDPLVFESALVLLAIMCLGTLGLIAQIYHTSGPLYRLCLVWSLLTLGLAYFAHHLFLPLLWSGFLLSGLNLAIEESPLFSQIKQAYHAYPELGCLCLSFLSASLALVSSKYFMNDNIKRAFKVWAFIMGLITLVAFETSYFFLDSPSNALSKPLINMSILIYALAMITFLLLIFSEDYGKGQKIIGSLILAAFLGLAHMTLWTQDELLRACLTLIILALIAIFLAGTNCRRLFATILFLIGLRFLILYFQAFGGLTLTGAGLIVSGLFIIGSAYLWQKYRNRLFTWGHDLTT